MQSNHSCTFNISSSSQYLSYSTVNNCSSSSDKVFISSSVISSLRGAVLNHCHKKCEPSVSDVRHEDPYHFSSWGKWKIGTKKGSDFPTSHTVYSTMCRCLQVLRNMSLFPLLFMAVTTLPSTHKLSCSIANPVCSAPQEHKISGCRLVGSSHC